MMYYRQPGELVKYLAEMDECMPHYYKITDGHGKGAENYSYFIETVYSEEYGMNGFFETALEKGRDHKIYFIAAMTNDDISDCAKYKVSRQFTEMESGVNLGGMFDQQSVLHFEMSSADAVRQLPAGFGFALLDDGTAVRMITPLV